MPLELNFFEGRLWAFLTRRFIISDNKLIYPGSFETRIAVYAILSVLQTHKYMNKYVFYSYFYLSLTFSLSHKKSQMQKHCSTQNQVGLEFYVFAMFKTCLKHCYNANLTKRVFFRDFCHILTTSWTLLTLSSERACKVYIKFGRKSIFGNSPT